MKSLPFVVMLASLVLAPLSLRAINTAIGASADNRSYVPSFENRRVRKPFRSEPIEELRYGNPHWVFIGDSMLGTRIDPRLLAEISGTGDRNALFLFLAASGPSYWYLSFKNHLIASGVKPRMTFFFFRDTNMTDTTFRLQSQLGDALDEVAHDVEPELDRIVAMRERGIWSGVDRTLNRFYQVETAAAWMHARVRQWYALWKYPEPAERVHFENTIEESFNQNFRRDLAADIADVRDQADFHRDLPSSVLPLIVELSKAQHVPVCFVRVQRRPVGNQPPPQSRALQKYVADFRAWAASQDVCFYDEHGDPELQREQLYEDGDHFLDRATYTRLFRRRLDPLFR